MSINRDSHYYDDIYRRYAEKYFCNYKDSEYILLWQKVIEKIPKDMPLTELGCGTGQFANMLIDLGFKYYCGYDFSQEAINAANKIQKSFMRIDLLNDKVTGDFFLALEIFEHTDDYKILQNIGLGKEIVFTVPDFNDAAHVRYFKDIKCAISCGTKVLNVC